MAALALASATLPAQESAEHAEPQQPTPAAVRYNELLAEFEVAQTAWFEQLQALAAAAEAEGRELEEYPEQPQAGFLPRFAAAAREFEGTDGAVDFLIWIVDNGWVDQDATRQALVALEKSHLASPRLEGMLFMFNQLEHFVGAENGLRFARKVEEQTTSPVVRAFAGFAVCERVLREEPIQSEAYQQARAHVMALVAPLEGRHAELAGSVILAEIEVRESFGVGMTAPDIVGVDLDGVEFRLSDYAGKILMVDFWGDW